MIVLSGADLVLQDEIRSPGTLVLEGDRITEVVSGARPAGAGLQHVDLSGHYIVPGFIDVHVHGVDGFDTLDNREAMSKIAAALPQYGVTGFCPTTVACAPAKLAEVLGAVRQMRSAPVPGARVLPAHLESNFISPEYRGAQPADCLRLPAGSSLRLKPEVARSGVDQYGADEILDEIQKAGSDVGIVTLAPELEGSLDLIRWLAKNRTHVSMGHSGASFEEAEAAIDAGARRATHLFNRMSPLGHRDPGLVGAVLTREEVAAEIICDGVHVHRAMVHLAIAIKGVHRMMAITDGTAAAGLPEGTFASLGGRRIRVSDGAAYLDDGTLAGSVATMDLVFAFLVNQVGLSLSDAARLCATTQAAELGLHDCGVIARDAMADLTVLDRTLAVKQTYVAGQLVFSSF